VKYGTLTEALQQELIEPLLPDIRKAFKDVLSKNGSVRDLSVAKLVIEIAGEIASKERMETTTIRTLVRKYLDHAAKPGETEEDVFRELNEEADNRHGSSRNGRAGSEDHRASEHLGKTG